MATSLQCPDEPYTINLTICRGRQAKGYEKCPSCPHHNAELPPAPEPVQPTPVPLPAGNRLMARAAPLEDLRSLARRIYDYF